MFQTFFYFMGICNIDEINIIRLFSSFLLLLFNHCINIIIILGFKNSSGDSRTLHISNDGTTGLNYPELVLYNTVQRHKIFLTTKVRHGGCKKRILRPLRREFFVVKSKRFFLKLEA